MKTEKKPNLSGTLDLGNFVIIGNDPSQKCVISRVKTMPTPYAIGKMNPLYTNIINKLKELPKGFYKLDNGNRNIHSTQNTLLRRLKMENLSNITIAIRNKTEIYAIIG